MLSTLERQLVESPAWALCLVFWVGAVTSMSSCTAVRLPVVLGYVAGSGGNRKQSALLTCLFVLGLVASYTLIGAAAAFAGGITDRLLGTTKYAFWALGVLLIVAGILLSGIVNVHVLPPQQDQQANRRFGLARPAGAVAIGFLFGLLTMPACPICGAGLLVLSSIVAAKNLALYGLAMFVSFALGQSAPLFAVGVLSTLLKPELIGRLRSHMCSAEQRLQLLAGNMVTVMGVYFLVVG